MAAVKGSGPRSRSRGCCCRDDESHVRSSGPHPVEESHDLFVGAVVTTTMDLDRAHDLRDGLRPHHHAEFARSASRAFATVLRPVATDSCRQRATKSSAWRVASLNPSRFFPSLASCCKGPPVACGMPVQYASTDFGEHRKSWARKMRSCGWAMESSCGGSLPSSAAGACSLLGHR